MKDVQVGILPWSGSGAPDLDSILVTPGRCLKTRPRLWLWQFLDGMCYYGIHKRSGRKDKGYLRQAMKQAGLRFTMSYHIYNQNPVTENAKNTNTKYSYKYHSF